jgi:lactoylglutathione lyase
MKLLHTMIRVRDLDAAIHFYQEMLDMKLFSRQDFPGGRFTLAFIGYDDIESRHLIELTHNWDTDDYTMGDAYGHIAIGVEDIYATCSRIKEKGGNVVREPGPMNHGTTHLAFIEDPDGYKIELIQT